MKRLTMNQVAKANLKANRRAYFSLAMGIFLAVYLACAACLCIQGTLLAKEEQVAHQVGWADTILNDTPSVTDDQLRESGFFDRLGHVYVTASVGESDVCTGYYDETAAELLFRHCTEGRLPQAPGEIAAERSALDILGLEEAQVGDCFTWAMHPLDGIPEERTFTLVGILAEQTSYLNQGLWSSSNTVKMPAILTAPGEPAYQVGRAAVHRVMTNRPLVTLNQIQEYGDLQFRFCYSVSRTLGHATSIDNTEYELYQKIQQVVLWVILGAALMLSTCVAIASAMESMLARKARDIGMLRAVGATRRQIRRLYGRDAWLLALTALPVGALLACATCFLLSLLMPGELVFRPTPWLLVPIIVLSFLCVFLASALPLRRASKQPPMDVLRDAAALHKANRLHDRKSFHATRLIAARQFRLHPLRQAGSACMAALMLLCALLLGEMTLNMNWQGMGSDSAFQMNLVNDFGSYAMEPFSQPADSNGLTASDVSQMRTLPTVSRVETLERATINLLLPDPLPDYLTPHAVTVEDENGEPYQMNVSAADALGDTRYLLPEESLPDDPSDMWLSWVRRTALQMRVLQQVSGVEQKLLPLTVLVATLDEDALSKHVTEGSINLEALDAGREVLVYAPNLCYQSEKDTWSTHNRYTDDELEGKDWDVVLQNDYFHAGQVLPFLQASGGQLDLLRSDGDEGELRAYYGAMDITTASPRIGAVLKGFVAVGRSYPFGLCLITTGKGAAALGLTTGGVESADVFLTGTPTAEMEEQLETSLERIAMRHDMELYNRLKSQRESRAYLLQALTLFVGMVLLFFAVSVTMQVTGTSRRIRADERMIGTLRAVGADKRALLGCYRLPTAISASFGFLLAAFAYLAMRQFYNIAFPKYHPWLLLVALAMAALNTLCAMAGIKRCLRQVMDRSIVENIKEL